MPNHFHKQCIFVTGVLLIQTMAQITTDDFFPDTKGNLTKITWSHATNSLELLQAALQNDAIMMMEADVQMGTVNDTTGIVPIMSHSDNKSDLSLEDFLTKVNDFNNATNNTKKGVKLDFKTIEAFGNSTSIIEKVGTDKFPVWINADIIKGPIKANSTPVDPDLFLSKAKSFSNSILSIGWTTNYGKNFSGNYNADQIKEMQDAIKKNNITQHITFPVRAGLAAQSIELFRNLLNEVPNSTLTIWSSEDDNVQIEDLRMLIAKVGVDKIYIDVPEDVLSQLHLDHLPNGSATVSASLALIGLLAIIMYV